MSNKPVIVIGGGGHASVLVDELKKQQREIKAIISPDEISGRTIFKEIPHFRRDEDILKFDPNDIELVNAIGSAPRSVLRRSVSKKYMDWGYFFATVISDSACVSENAEIKEGAQILTRAVIHPGSVIASHVVVNTGAIIEHDCFIGAHTFIAPGAVLCGQVITGENVFIGAGATIIQNITVGEHAIVGAGAILVASLEAGSLCYPDQMKIKSFHAEGKR